MNTSTYQPAQASNLNYQGDIRSLFANRPGPYEEGINQGAFNQMAEGLLPDLRDVCLTLAEIMHGVRAPESVNDLFPVLEALPALDEKSIKSLLKNRETRHVLMSGDNFEVVLNHWKPGKASDIHGHSSGGCLFKLL